jgi:hypothetical protein
MTETFIPLDAVAGHGRPFTQFAESNPCDGCSAPCCRIVLTPHAEPRTFTDLDYIRYLLGFPDTEMIVARDGSWQALSHRTCLLLDLAEARCTVHGTPRKPKVCVFFDPYRCWYKRNFTTADPPDIVRLDLSRFEAVLSACVLDDEGRLTEVPTWERMRELVPPPTASATVSAAGPG